MRFNLFALFSGLIWAASFACQAAPVYTPQTNYILRCVGCHGINGSGSSIGGIPDFRNYVASFSQTQKGRQYLMHVPGVVASSLTDREIAEVMNYVMLRWGGESLPKSYQPFTKEEVSILRQISIKDVVKYRREVVKEIGDKLPIAPYPWP